MNLDTKIFQWYKSLALTLIGYSFDYEDLYFRVSNAYVLDIMTVFSFLSDDYRTVLHFFSFCLTSFTAFLLSAHVHLRLK